MSCAAPSASEPNDVGCCSAVAVAAATKKVAASSTSPQPSGAPSAGPRGYPVHPRERERLRGLRRFDILDTEETPSFDRLTALAARLFDCPIALVSLVDEDRQWFKSHHGLAARETHRDLAFCNYVVAHPENKCFVVNDADVDPRFRNNSLVTGHPFIRFYAGAPLIFDREAGLAAGSLCVISDKRREEPFTEEDRDILSHLAAAATDLLFWHRESKLRNEEQSVRRMVALGHTLRNPLHVFKHSLDIARSDVRNGHTPSLDILDGMESAFQALTNAVQDLCLGDQASVLSEPVRCVPIRLDSFLRDIVNWFRIHVNGVLFVLDPIGAEEAVVDRVKLRQLIDNMINIAVRGLFEVKRDLCYATSSRTREFVKPVEAAEKIVMVRCTPDYSTGSIEIEVQGNGVPPPLAATSDGLVFDSQHLYMCFSLAEKLDVKFECTQPSTVCDTSVFSTSVSIQVSGGESIMSETGAHFVRTDSDVSSFSSLSSMERNNPAGPESNAAKTRGAAPVYTIGQPPSKRHATPNPAPRALRTRADITALCVEDEPANRLIIKRILTKIGLRPCNIILRNDGDDVDPAKMVEPDICFLDIIMHRENGDALCERLRAAGWSCPIIATTGNGAGEDRLKKIGFSHVLFKPFSASDIESTLMDQQAEFAVASH